MYLSVFVEDSWTNQKVGMVVRASVPSYFGFLSSFLGS